MRSRMPRALALMASAVGVLGLTVAATPAAMAQVTPPPSVVPIGGNGSTISGVTINGQTTTVATVAPGSTISMQATLTLGNGVNPYWAYWVGYGFGGDASASGCSNGASGYGATDTTNFTLTAPTLPGVFEVKAALGPDYCPWGGGVVIAKIEVTPTFASVCTLTQDYSSSPTVAASMCDKLYAAQDANARGQSSTKAKILAAYNQQLAAQTGKAFTAEEAAALKGFVAML